MNRGFKAGFVACLVPLALLTASLARTEGCTTPNGYPSPKAVFDAYRDARHKRDWRTVFFCLTPDGQKDALFEALFACSMHESKEELAILTKYCLDNATLAQTLTNEYKEKHGAYPEDDAALDGFLKMEYAADRAESGKVESGAEPGPVPRAVVCNILAAHIKDKAGFFDAVAMLSKRPISPLGGLEQIIVRGDTAAGSAKLTYIPTPGESPRIVNPTDKAFRFRKVDRGWSLESL